MKKELPQVGDTRIVKKFAWIPVIATNPLTNKKEERWLETVVIKQRFYNLYGWKDCEFIND